MACGWRLLPVDLAMIACASFLAASIAALVFGLSVLLSSLLASRLVFDRFGSGLATGIGISTSFAFLFETGDRSHHLARP